MADIRDIRMWAVDTAARSSGFSMDTASLVQAASILEVYVLAGDKPSGGVAAVAGRDSAEAA